MTAAEVDEDALAGLSKLSTSHGDVRMARSTHAVAAELTQLRKRNAQLEQQIAELQGQSSASTATASCARLPPGPSPSDPDAVSALCAVM